PQSQGQTRTRQEGRARMTLQHQDLDPKRPEKAIEEAAMYLAAREKVRAALADGDWHPAPELYRSIPEALAHTCFRGSPSWEQTRDAASQPDLVGTFRIVLGQEVVRWMVRDGLVDSRVQNADLEVRLAQSARDRRDLGLDRIEEAHALGNKIVRRF